MAKLKLGCECDLQRIVIMESGKRENVTEAKDRSQVQAHHCVEIIQSTLKFICFLATKKLYWELTVVSIG